MAATYARAPANDEQAVRVFLSNDDNDGEKEETTPGNDDETKMTVSILMMKKADDDVEKGEGDDNNKGDDTSDSDDRDTASLADDREFWSKKREYILTMMGYTVGIGNLWRFPYMCNRNGGGAFLFPFILCLSFIGFPLFFLESALGQFTGRSPLQVWNVCPLVKGVGIAMCIVSMINFWYFNTIMSWGLYYLVSSFQSIVPWSRCDQWWNTPQCVNYHHSANLTSGNVTSSLNVTSSQLPGFNSSMGVAGMDGNSTDPLKLKVVTAAEEFWQHNVLQVSSGFYEPGHLVWYLVVMQCIVLLIIFLALLKGIKSAGKVVYVTATAPYVILTVLVIRGVTLPGAREGILFYITPDFERLLDPKVWVEAALQVFYSLGPAWGGLIAMASYNKFDNNCLRDSLVLSFLGEGTSVFGGFAIFSVLGYMAHETGVPIDKVVSAGPGLAFIVYPEAISMLPLPQLWAILFFFMVLTLVIDTQLAGGETVLTVLCDSFPRTLARRRVLLTGVFCLVFLLSSFILVSQGGVYVFQLFDWFIATITVSVIALTECVVMGWVYGANRFGEDIQMMLGRKPPLIINILWCIVDPLLLTTLLVFTLAKYEPPVYGSYKFDTLSTAFGWLIALVSFVPIPGMAVYELMKAKGTFLQRLKQTTTPEDTWGPADLNRRILYRKQTAQRSSHQSCFDILR